MSNIKNIEKYIEIISCNVSGFDINSSDYTKFTPMQLGIDGDESNSIYIKGQLLPSAIKISFNTNSKNCHVFIGQGIYGATSRITANASNNFIYIGDRCGLKNLNLMTSEDNDVIVVGNEVTTTSNNMWTTGHYSGVKGKAIIIGDDCMFSYGITIRASDGHPVFSIDDMTQLNSPQTPVVIEPHCWVGQNVSILKGVKIGACSIVAISTVVTKSTERFSLVAGVPSTTKTFAGKIWARNHSKEAILKAQFWGEKYTHTEHD